MAKRLLDDCEIEWLASAYLKLKENKEYKKLSKEFKDFVSEYLDEELLTLKKGGLLKCKKGETK